MLHVFVVSRFRMNFHTMGSVLPFSTKLRKLIRIIFIDSKQSKGKLKTASLWMNENIYKQLHWIEIMNWLFFASLLFSQSCFSAQFKYWFTTIVYNLMRNKMRTTNQEEHKLYQNQCQTPIMIEKYTMQSDPKTIAISNKKKNRQFYLWPAIEQQSTTSRSYSTHSQQTRFHRKEKYSLVFVFLLFNL